MGTKGSAAQSCTRRSHWARSAADRIRISISNTGTNAADWYCEEVGVAVEGEAAVQFPINDWIRAGEPGKSYPRAARLPEESLAFEPCDGMEMIDEITRELKKPNE